MSRIPGPYDMRGNLQKIKSTAAGFVSLSTQLSNEANSAAASGEPEWATRRNRSSMRNAANAANTYSHAAVVAGMLGDAEAQDSANENASTWSDIASGKKKIQ